MEYISDEIKAKISKYLMQRPKEYLKFPIAILTILPIKKLYYKIIKKKETRK